MVRLPKLAIFFVMMSAALALAGCATSAGRSEFLAFRAAFQASETAASALLDVVAVAERRVRGSRASIANPSGIFRIEDAEIFATNVDPPTVGELRRAIAAVGSYSGVMVALATGETASTLSAELAALGRDSLALANAVGIDAGLATAAMPAAQKLAELALRAQSQHLFRAQLVDGDPAIIDVIRAIRDAGPTLFEFLNADDRALRGDIAARLTRREDNRRLVSDWVVLWDRHLRALEDARAAAISPTGAARLATLRATVADMTAAAAAMRQSLAAMRAP